MYISNETTKVRTEPTPTSPLDALSISLAIYFQIHATIDQTISSYILYITFYCLLFSIGHIFRLQSRKNRSEFHEGPHLSTR